MNDEIISRLDAVIAARGKSRSGACKAAGLDSGYIRDLKRYPDTSPTIRTITKFAEYLDVDPDWLAFGLSPPPNFESDDAALRLASERYRAMRLLMKHGVSDTAAVLSMLEGLGPAERAEELNAIAVLLRAKKPSGAE